MYHQHIYHQPGNCLESWINAIIVWNLDPFSTNCNCERQVIAFINKDDGYVYMILDCRINAYIKSTNFISLYSEFGINFGTISVPEQYTYDNQI